MSARTAAVERIVDCGVVAVVRGAPPEEVIAVVEALTEGGVDVVEITADTPGVLDMLEEVTASFDRGEVLLGAGTVLDSETARSVTLAGAEFVVTPTLDEDVIETCNRYGYPVVPGIMTPTEALTAVEAGADMCKVFPASTVGPGHLSAIKGPLEQIPLVPTGGVDIDNAAEFVDAGAAAVGAGSALVPGDAVEAGDYGEITERAERFVAAVASARE